jgi:hypothetical protein
MKYFDLDFSIIKQLPSYQKIIGLGWRDTTTPAQRSHGNLDFSGNPKNADEKITVYYNGVIRGYSEAEYMRSSQPGKWANLSPYRIKKDPSVINNETDYEPVLAEAYRYLLKRIHRYDKWMATNKRDILRAVLWEDNMEFVSEINVDELISPRDYYDSISQLIRRMKEPIS